MLHEDVMRDEPKIRASVMALLERDLYPGIKKRVMEETRIQYEQNPQLELRLQQQQAFRALHKLE